MKVILDTNVLISPFVFGGKVRKALEILLTGDNNFLESKIVTPKIISPTELLENFLRKGIFYG